MKNVSTSTRAVGLSMAALVLAACSGTNSAMSPPAPGANVQLPGSTNSARAANPHAGWMSREAKTSKKLIYASSSGNGSIASAVFVYSTKGQSQPPIGMITDGISTAQGIGTDSSGNLYVANNGNSTVTEYAPGTTSPSTTYTNGVSAPYDVKVGSDGRVYVANLTGSPSGLGSVSEYPAGSTTPDRTLTNGGAFAISLALDASNNLYVGWWSYGTYAAQVLKYAPGSTNGTNLGLDLPPGSFPLYGLAIDHSGNLVLWYESLDHSIAYLAAFPPGATEPKYTIQGGSFMSNVFGIAFAKSGNPYVVSPNKNLIVLWKYPKGIPLDVINLGAASGVALSPGT
jgi:hypothetical protein